MSRAESRDAGRSGRVSSRHDVEGERRNASCTRVSYVMYSRRVYTSS